MNPYAVGAWTSPVGLRDHDDLDSPILAAHHVRRGSGDGVGAGGVERINGNGGYMNDADGPPRGTHRLCRHAVLRAAEGNGYGASANRTGF